MTNHMYSRGPDAEGLWTSDGIALGHRRLAILDLDARANQPMVSVEGRYAIVFNGEIYNFRELRRRLEAKGVRFRTTSDTEVLLALFASEREGMLPWLRGMFAMAVWDGQARELFLARDPYGIKPLYYARTTNGLLFASQAKALVASGMVPTDREPAGLAGFYLWGSVPEPWTIYRGIFALPAGNFLRVHAGVPERPVCWHDIRRHWQGDAYEAVPDDLPERVQCAVSDSVRAHLIADVPVSILLSGGVDSTAVAGLAAGLGARVEGITIGFTEFSGREEDEVPAAVAVARHYGLPHFVRLVSRAEFQRDLPAILSAMDQPSIDGVNTWFASKAAAERGYKVVLSGVGGDELFCGYSSFRRIPKLVSLGRAIAAVPGARVALRVPCAYLAWSRSQPKFVGIPAFMDSFVGMYFLTRGLFLPEDLPSLMGTDMAQDGLDRLGGSPPGLVNATARDGTALVGLLESTTYLRNQLLRDGDWASMAHSLELRTPLADAELLRTLGPLASAFVGGVGKALLACAPEKLPPEWVVSRAKTGFNLPFRTWLSDVVDTTVSTKQTLRAARRWSWGRRWARMVVQAMAERS